MIVYHGTTYRRARRICAEGFLPKKPSRRVWFAESHGYALGRAKTQARRARDRAVVLTCELDLNQMRKSVGARRLFHKSGIIAVDGHVPVAVVRSYPAPIDQPSSPEDLAQWINNLLGLKPHKGVSKRHPGIDRLSRWVVNRMASRPDSTISERELLAMARPWLPEFFEGVEIDPQTLRARPQAQTIEVKVEPPAEQRDPREDEALECLAAPKPNRRIRGLAILADMEDPDLFDWCAMFLADDSRDVRIAALRTMLRCKDGDPEVIAPFVESDDKRVRAAAIAALAKHAGRDRFSWLERALKDPEPCVRSETAALLTEIDPARHRVIFELALHDPNPEIARRAKKLTAGKGYAQEW